MEIRYQGGASFVVKGDKTIAINPLPGSSAAIVLKETRQKPTAALVSGPGEYEIAGVLIVTRVLPDGHLIHAVDLAGVNVVFAGDRPAGIDMLAEDLGTVDVLVVGTSDPGEAEKASRDLNARVTIPFGVNAAKVCSALGGDPGRSDLKFNWDGSAKHPKSFLLRPPGRRSRAA